MKRTIAFSTLFLLLTAGAGQAVTVDELVARHIEARGGRAAWDALGALRIEGQFTGFSQVNPFVLHRMADGRYHLDHMLGDKLVIVGWDGEIFWWENNWMQEGAQKITGADLAVAVRDIEYPLTPFFDIESAGHQVELVGDAEIDGIDVVAVKLTRQDGSEETWFFDPDTYLEVARDSPGSDFGQPMTQRTIFDAFEPVGSGGAVMPHYVESQWYTRHRVMDVEKVATGVEVDPALFAMPAPVGMAEILPLVGEWTVEAETRRQPGAEPQTSTRTATITAELGRGLVRERMQAGEVVWERSLAYDRFRQQYVLTTINDRDPYPDIMRGTMENGVVTVSNVDTGTTRNVFGRVIHGRLTVKDITDSGFVLEHQSSIDGGESWFTDATMTYTRATGGSSATAD